MSVAEARAAARLINTGMLARQFVDSALGSGKPEIIEVCWQEAATDLMLRDAMTKMPDSALKDQLVSRFLRKPVGWPSDSPLEWKGDLMRAGRVRFIIPLVQGHLPDTPMDFSVIATREKRLNLADAFDTAAGIPIEREPDAKRIWPPLKLGDTPIIASTPFQRDDKTTQPNAAAPTAPVAKAGESWPLRGGWAPWACIAVAIAGIAVWLGRRLRHRNG